MNIMICGGGTAGHVYPGLALAEALEGTSLRPEVIFVGSDRGLESSVVPEAGYILETLPIKGMPRRISFKALSFGASLGFSLIKSARLIKKYQPKVVVGMGGFASFPMVTVAARLGYPTLIHEQNAVPGLANRRLSRRADLLALTYDDNLDLVKKAKVIQIVGNPIRSSVLKAKRRAAVKKLGLDERLVTVLIFGGSRGSRRINEAVVGAYDSFRNAHNLQIVHIAGEAEYKAVEDKIDAVRQGRDKVRYHLFPYIKEIGLAYAAADLAVTRAGATTLAELTARGLPSILIPYPYATDNHQLINARWLELSGAAKVIIDENFNEQLFWQAVSSLVYHPSALKEMAERSAKQGRPKAARDLARLVLRAAERHDVEMGKKKVH